MLDNKEIERSIIKRYRKYLWAPFVKAIKEYKMIEKNDCIAVAVSGGKDSLLMAKLFQELKKHSDFVFDLKFISMDPGFSKENREKLEENAIKLEMPLLIKNSDIFLISEKLDKEKPCYMCARMRRGFLYSMAKENGCNKVALAHHFNDVIETTLLNLIYAGSIKTMPPKVKSTNFEGMQLIRPLYFIKEDSVNKFINYNQIEAMNCGCKYLENVKLKQSKRDEMKELIENIKKNFAIADLSIFKAMANINLNTILGYELDGKKHSFNDIYERGEIVDD